MAAKHNFNTGPIARYKPTDPGKGSFRFCYNENEVAVAHQDGFTTANYVPSKYPTTAFHKKTGATKVVGKLGDTDEDVLALVVKLGPDWGLDYVPEPEPVEEKKAAANSGIDLAALLQLGGQIALLGERLGTIEAALIESEQAKTALAARLGQLEGVVLEPSPELTGKKK